MHSPVCVRLAAVPGELCRPLYGGEEWDAGCHGEGGRKRRAWYPCTTASLDLSCEEGRIAVAWECRWLFLACWDTPGASVWSCGQNASAARLGSVQAPDRMEILFAEVYQ